MDRTVEVRTNIVIGWLLGAVLTGSGGIAMAAASATEDIKNPRKWWRVAWLIALLAASINFAIVANFVGRPGYLVLGRDIFVQLLIVFGITLAVAGLCRWLLNRNMTPGKRFAIAGIAAFLMSVPAPFIVLMVHCTGGDCL